MAVLDEHALGDAAHDDLGSRIDGILEKRLLRALLGP
jgi:hypothetical protein